ncbi:hypothetical protein FE257_004277 [Aspergillus nanangensis]|uniref:Nephrocystin 3-like N-terminal domain-containing protein n=1 Tax=Aspergillus nanangensis TaxID=2582783 RepID=A0AAD4CRI9_ASPNN|nr:hypothetical protein FE257_004277 [Aspergillus nanangensis]
MKNTKRLQPADYTIAWICALPVERAAAEAMLDETMDHTISPKRAPMRILTPLAPSPAIISSSQACPLVVQYGLVVGVGGGAPMPSKGTDIRLGDVVVSRPTGRFPGVVQYDFGKAMQGGEFETIGVLNKPPTFLLNLIGKLEARYDRGEGLISGMLETAATENASMTNYFKPPGGSVDRLFQPSYPHVGGSDLTSDGTGHYHASLSVEYATILTPTKTRSGSHTLQVWQLPTQGAPCFDTITATGFQECLRTLFLTNETEHINALKRKKGDRVVGTCEWILDTNEFQEWVGENDNSQEDRNTNVLWLHSSPGTGKSMVAITIAEELPKRPSFYLNNKTFLYFFCDSTSDHHRKVTALLRAVIYQLVSAHSQLLEKLAQMYIERDDIFSSFDSLWNIFIELAQDTETGQKYVMIDGLDECYEDSQHILLSQIGLTFNQNNDNAANIHLLVVSRNYANIREELYVFPNTPLSSFARSKEDIQIFIHRKVQELKAKKRYTHKLAKEVSEILADKADGTFVWIGVACLELMDVASRDALKTLRRLPKGLYDMYESLLQHTLEHDPDLWDRINVILKTILVTDGQLFVLDVAKACCFILPTT